MTDSDVTAEAAEVRIVAFGRTRDYPDLDPDYPLATDLGVVADDDSRDHDPACVATMVEMSHRNVMGENVVHRNLVEPTIVNSRGYVVQRSSHKRKFFRMPLKKWVKPKFARLGATLLYRKRSRTSTNLRDSNGGHSFEEVYSIGGFLGRGAFSTVSEATNRQTRDKFAVKAVDKTRLSNEEATALQDEIAILREIDHPNIIHLYDVFDEGERCYLVTERTLGGELFDRIVQKTYYNEFEAREVCKGLFSAVKYLHSRNIAHRDLKPENILFEAEGDDSIVKLADFGFAKKCSSPNFLLTRCGTPRYIAPEILNGGGYGTQADMWSLGVILFVMLGGYPPFNDENDRELFHKIRRGEFEFHDDYWSEVSFEAKDFISSLLTVDPTRRITAADALRSPWMLGETLGINQVLSIPSIETFGIDDSSVMSAIIELPFDNTRNRESPRCQNLPVVKDRHRQYNSKEDPELNDEYIQRWMVRRKNGRSPEDDFSRAVRVSPILVDEPTQPPPPSSSDIGSRQPNDLCIAQNNGGINPGASVAGEHPPVERLPFAASAYYSAVSNKLNACPDSPIVVAKTEFTSASKEQADNDVDSQDNADYSDEGVNSLDSGNSDDTGDPPPLTDKAISITPPANENYTEVVRAALVANPIDYLHSFVSQCVDSPSDTTSHVPHTENVDPSKDKLGITRDDTAQDVTSKDSSLLLSLPSSATIDSRSTDPGATISVDCLEERILQYLSTYSNSAGIAAKLDTIALLHSFASDVRKVKTITRSLRSRLVRSRSFSDGMRPTVEKSVEEILECLASYCDKLDSIALLHSFASNTDQTKVVDNSLWNVGSTDTALVKLLSTYLDATSRDIKPDSISLLHSFRDEAASKGSLATSHKERDTPPDNPYKIVFVGAPKSGKSSIVHKLANRDQCTTSVSSTGGYARKRFRVNVHSWEPISAKPQDSVRNCSPNITFKVFDFSSDAHHTSQSLFFSPDSLYVLPWDLGANNPKTWRRGKHPNSPEEGDEYSIEDADRIADRELERSVMDDFISWIDFIIETVGDKCTILPIATFSDVFDAQEASRRCTLMKHSLLDHYDYLRQARSERLPKLLFECGNEEILRMGNIDDEDVCRLKALILGSSKACSSFSENIGIKISDTALQIRKQLPELKRKYKIVHVDHILSEINSDPHDELKKKEVTTALQCLSSLGELYFFGESTQASDGSRSELQESLLGEFAVLCPNWLSAVISCVVQKKEWWGATSRLSIYALWSSVKNIKESAERAAETIGDSSACVFQYLYDLLVHRGVIFPVVTSKPCDAHRCQSESTLHIIPSLLEDVPPDIWTYRSRKSWKGTLSYAWSFKGSLPPRLMDRVTASVVQKVFNNSLSSSNNASRQVCDETEGYLSHKPLKVRSVNCWKDAIMLELGMYAVNRHTNRTEEYVNEIFIHLDSNLSAYCIAPKSMCNTDRRLVISATGDIGGGGQRIWEGGFKLLIQSIEDLLKDFAHYDVKSEIVCPECTSNHHQSDVHVWGKDFIYKNADNGCQHVRCGKNGHLVETNLLCGRNLGPCSGYLEPGRDASKPVDEIINGVVLIALWDNEKKEMKRVGSGFIIDRKRGLIVTAAHVLIDIQSKKNFGKNFYGLDHGEACIGVISQTSHSSKASKCISDRTKAEFRYTAEIVTKDVSNVDACVLRITGKINQGFERDYSDIDFGKEKLQQLHFAKYECNLDEEIRVLGYNQGGEGLSKPGAILNHYLDFAWGYVCKIFRHLDNKLEENSPDTFTPQEEIVVMCPTICGQSGGPCVNNEGAVVGILSRADPVDCRSYLVPVSELKALVKKAKKAYNYC